MNDMDAHHAAEPTATKQTASPASSSAPTNPGTTSATSDPSTSIKLDKDKAKLDKALSMTYKSASLPTSTTPTPSKKHESKPTVIPTHSTTHGHTHGADDDATADNNSEAETIVLAGKDGSPIKSRKIIKREDSDGDGRSHTPDVVKRRATNPSSSTDANPWKSESSGPLREGSHGGSAASSVATKSLVDPAKRKRLVDHPQTSSSSKASSSALSSTPGTPLLCAPPRHPADGLTEKETDSESVHAKPAKPLSSRVTKDKDVRDHGGRDRERERDRDKDSASAKIKSGDRVVVPKRKVPRNDSDNEADPEAHKVRRQRTSASIDASSSRPPQKDRDHPKISAIKTTHETTVARRSESPRNHRRSASTQVASHSSGLSHKKKRIPPPLSTDYHSDVSSGSGSPHIRSSTARGLATPATAESMMSSANRNPAHKKHTDAHGQTQLAKACSRGDLEVAKRKLADRRQDLNTGDNAGNTPLQCAAINGHHEIVAFLIKEGCEFKEVANYDKDTPLLDAVENGHLEVVKILLEAGVNPRKANIHGQEPLDLVTDDMDDADAIREELTKAKEKAADLRRSPTEDPQNDRDSLSPHSTDSPHRQSPSFPETSRRGATSHRTHKMSNKVLYQPLNLEALREAAGKGDEEIVQRILAIREFNDPESMVAAAKGGHEGVMNLLLAIGGCHPDPPMGRSGKDEEHSTPILAAIGHENVEVIKLLLLQANFDPTRKYKGKTYYEIARERAGPSWKEEETILKTAYDEYRKTHRDPTKKSPNRKDQESKRSGRTETKDDSKTSSKRKANSPSRDAQRVPLKAKAGDKEHKRTTSEGPRSDEPSSPKRGTARARKDDSNTPTIAISGAETVPRPPRSPKAKRADPETTALTSDGETIPRVRNKLLTRKEMNDRRGSLASNSSSLREPSSPGDTRHDDFPSEKYHDRAKSIKEDESRDKSRDKLSVSSEHSAKRSRNSATPDHGSSEKEGEPAKKRRLDVDKKDRVAKASASPDRNRKPATSRDTAASAKHDDKPVRKHGDQAEKRAPSKSRKPEATSEPARRDASSKSVTSDKSIHVNLKADDSDAVMRDADSTHGDDSKSRAKEDDKKRRIELEAKKKQKEKDMEERKQRDEEQRRQAEAKKQEEAEKEKKRLEEERKKQEDDARKKREADEAQRKAKEELEKRQAEEARSLREKLEQERKKKEEEERLRKEKEAADEARRKREDEERREQERRAQEELRQRQIREERERKRLDRLPASLRWLERSTDAKTQQMAKRWRQLRGVRFDSIRPESAGTTEGRELWVLNTQVAMLLGESDIQLTRFPNWDHVSAPQPAKHLVMSLAAPGPSLTLEKEWDLGRQLPDYYLGKAPNQLTRQERRQLEKESKAKYLALDLFFIKLTDFLLAVPSIPHLRSIEIIVTFHEAAATLDDLDNNVYPSRWRDDPDADRYMGYCPRAKYYLNGNLVREGQVDTSSARSKPWPVNRVPRIGLTAVPPTDPNYARLAKEQGIGHVDDFGLHTPPMTTAAQTSPNQLFAHRSFGDLSPPQSESTATANGDGTGHHQPRSSTSSTGEQDRPLVNGNSVPFPLQNGAGGGD